MSEQGEVPQDIESTTTTPFDAAYQVVTQLREQVTGNKLDSLLAWFPTPERQQALEAADKDTKAAFTAEALGHYIDWQDAVSFLHIYRPQDGGTAAGELGLTQEESYAILPTVQEVTKGVDQYANYLVQTVNEGNLPLIASKVTTTGQAIGLHQELMGVLGGDMEDAKITFSDGTSIDDAFDTIIYLFDEASRKTVVEKASYDPTTREYLLHLPKR